MEIDEPTQPYSRARIDRLRRGSKPPPQEQRIDAERPDVTHVSTRGTLTVVPDEASEDAGARGLQGWFELDGRWVRVCLGSFAHFGFSGAPAGMIGAVDASFLSGTIGGDRSAALHLEQAQVAQAPGSEREDLQPFSRRHKWKLWVLVASPLALALAAWVLARNDAGSVEPMTRAPQQVRTDVPSQPAKLPSEVSTKMPIQGALPSGEPDEIPSPDEPPKSRKDFGACVEHRKSATDARAGGDWERLLELATRRRNCWSRVSANALQMEALFELGRYPECVQLGAQDGSKKEIGKWLNACQLNL